MAHHDIFTKAELNQRLQSFIERIKHRQDIVALYLFGSYAANRPTLLSDIDLAVLFDKSVAQELFLPERLRLLAELSSMLGRDNVELIVLNEAPPSLGYRVLRDGKLLFAGNNADSQIVNFKVKTLDRYFDYQPAQKIFSEGLARRIEEGGFGG
ncbi:type VII toxin-antitoxin system MntA family adenylyltransferase antitoxin [Paradesulfitobacterium ferrireducens]|uniref:type VII toxin-antitoxin system MntA family adenylyltransferase antitoxin n=1 Tax=Paradesulfitobacterium ferrireducens TaxID=2816476 RepID=UPI001A8D127B|nr:nucleotidyltransferase domain-containing protein [Paradesulfitobacterium ferrireducens]